MPKTKTRKPKTRTYPNVPWNWQPNADEIAERSAECRSRWSEAERLKRNHYPPQTPVVPTVSVPRHLRELSAADSDRAAGVGRPPGEV